MTWPWSPPAGPGWGREVSSSRTCFAGGHRFTPLVLRGGGFLASLGQLRHTVGPQSSDPHPAPATSGPGVPGSVDRSTHLPHLAAAWPEPDCMPCLSFPIGQGGTEAAPPHRVRKRNLWPCLGAGPLLSARSPEVLDTLSCVRVGELSSVSSHEATSFFEKPDFAHLDLSTEGDAILPFAPQLSAPRLALPAPTLRVAVSGLPAHLSRSPRPSSVPSLPHPAHPAPAPRAHSVCTGAHSWGPALLIAPPPPGPVQRSCCAPLPGREPLALPWARQTSPPVPRALPGRLISPSPSLGVYAGN